jgi:hypothetical protein
MVAWVLKLGRGGLCAGGAASTYIFDRYMFRPSPAIFRWSIQYFKKSSFSQLLKISYAPPEDVSRNKHLEQLLRKTVLPITLSRLLPEDGNRIQSPKFCVLNKEQDDG